MTAHERIRLFINNCGTHGFLTLFFKTLGQFCLIGHSSSSAYEIKAAFDVCQCCGCVYYFEAEIVEINVP